MRISDWSSDVCSSDLFGHRTRYWNPKMDEYIFGSRSRIHIINLEQTLPMLKDACSFAGKLAANGGRILFVGTKRAARETIEEEAHRCGMPYVNQRWLGGTLTNFKRSEEHTSGTPVTNAHLVC